MEGSAGVAAMVRGKGHQSLLPNCAHQVGPGVVKVDGDTAEATTYSRVYLREGDAYRVLARGRERVALRPHRRRLEDPAAHQPEPRATPRAPACCATPSTSLDPAGPPEAPASR